MIPLSLQGDPLKKREACNRTCKYTPRAPLFQRATVPHQDWGRARAAGNKLARDDKEPAPDGGHSYPENGLVKSPSRDKRALSPAGMFVGKAPLRLAALKSRLHAPSVPFGSAPAYFLCKRGV
jgi:hypothetical protein